jgi:NAD(P)-dependent dehydrogenase (short-subunit alcohol dehydrogenase family)
MPMNPAHARALVLGGTSYLGRAVVRGFASASVPTIFTYFQSKEQAEALANENAGCAGQVLDASDPAALRDLIATIPAAEVPTHVVHCITAVKAGRCESRACRCDRRRLGPAHAVNVRSAFVAAQALAPQMRETS